MPALQIRNCPDDIGVVLKERAAANHRTLSQEAIAVLESYFERERRFTETKASQRKRAELFERLAACASFDLPGGASSARALIDEGREEWSEPCLC